MYSQTTLDSIAVRIGILLDDTNELYWTRPEKYLAIYEGLRVWGAYTSYWRTRGSITLTPPGAGTSSPYFDMSVLLPGLRTRSWTVGQMVQDIQYMCQEAANGVSGAGMSKQTTVAAILNAIFQARNRFVLDTHIPLHVSSTDSAPPPPQGMVSLPESTIYVHRAAWLDSYTGVWTNLWRQDAWALDHANTQWTIQPGNPVAFSESESAPLSLQLCPPPIDEGALEIVDVESVRYTATGTALANETFYLPDEWVHGVKYAALSNMFGPDSQMKDPLRQQYAETRYKQAVDGARSIRSILRVLVNGMTTPIDTLAALDSGMPYWRNQSGPPQVMGVLSDMLVCAPVPDAVYGATIDVVQSAPLPFGPTFVQIGDEELDNLMDYCTHILTFKCGGNEFKSTFGNYDGYMGAVALRGQINKAKVQYLVPLFDQPSKEQEQRPEQMGQGAANA